MSRHANNFDLLRLGAALLVIYGHQLQMKGIAAPLPLGVPISKTGLDVFFSVSGYLVSESWLRVPRWKAFLHKRALRIFPGLIAVVAASVFLLGPLASDLGAARYFAGAGTWAYLGNAALHLQNDLPGVFGHGHREHAVNGSLWSLFPEFLCYLATPFLLLPARALRPLLLSAGALGMAWLGFRLPAGTHLFVYGSDARFILLEAPFFIGGALWRSLDGGGGSLYRTELAIPVCVARAVLAVCYATPGMMLDPILLPYLVIAFGRGRVPLAGWATRWGDLSYGLYLYAFPMQQVMIDLGARHALPAALGATLVLAFLSWHLVEKPALRLKPAASLAPPRSAVIGYM